uniref:Uncharacterized protein n=1 Tax=Rhizophora mucronata TaxID=61149 RepID=A0A2P2K3B2_RHIMU
MSGHVIESQLKPYKSQIKSRKSNKLRYVRYRFLESLGEIRRKIGCFYQKYAVF